MATMIKNGPKSKLSKLLEVPSSIKKGISRKTKVAAVVAAGGKGERLFPFSTNEVPKQFCAINGVPLITQAAKRIVDTGLVKASDTYVFVTDENQYNQAYDCLKKIGVPAKNIFIYRPDLDYAGCMLQIANDLHEKYGRDTVLINTPSDNYLEGEGVKDALTRLVDSARTNGPTILGIHRSNPESIMPYGNAVFENFINSRNSPRVVSFVEKPSYETALSIIKAGNCAVNSGINAWKIGDIIDAYDIKKLGDDKSLSTDELMRAFGNNLYIEVATNVKWDDLGSFDSIKEKLPATKNHLNSWIGENQRKGCLNSLFVAAKNKIKINADDIRDEFVVANIINDTLVIMITDRAHAQYVKKFAQEFRNGIDNGIYQFEAMGNIVKNDSLQIDIVYGFIGINHNTVCVTENGGEYTVHVSGNRAVA